MLCIPRCLTLRCAEIPEVSTAPLIGLGAGQGAVGKEGKVAGTEHLWVPMGWITLLWPFSTVAALKTTDKHNLLQQLEFILAPTQLSAAHVLSTVFLHMDTCTSSWIPPPFRLAAEQNHNHLSSSLVLSITFCFHINRLTPS